jgi:hypothetical protein
MEIQNMNSVEEWRKEIAIMAYVKGRRQGEEKDDREGRWRPRVG